MKRFLALLIALGGMIPRVYAELASVPSSTPHTLATNQLAPCTPSGHPSNPLLPILSILKKEMANFKSIEYKKERTDNCLPSILFIRSETSDDFTEKFINAYVGNYVGRDVSNIKECPTGNTPCCWDEQNTNVRCITDSNTNPRSHNSQKFMYGTRALIAISHEIAKNSFVVKDTATDLGNHKVPGDTIIFMWSRLVTLGKDNARYVVFTKLDADLMTRVSTVVSQLMPTIRAASNLAYPGSSSVVCTGSGTRPVPYDQTKVRNSVRISTGTNSNVRRPRAIEYPFTLSIDSGKADGLDFTAITSLARLEPPIGGSNQSLIEYATKMKSTDSIPFPCYGNALRDLLFDNASIRFFNTSESAVFSASLIYLTGIVAEVTRKSTSFKRIFDDFANDARFWMNPQQELNRSILSLSKRNTKALAPSKSAKITSGKNCPALCKQKDPACLLVELKDERRYAGLKGLYTELFSPLPFEISQQRLGELFGPDASAKSRTSIFAREGQLVNSGGQVSVTVDVQNLMNVRMEFPVIFESEIRQSGASKVVDLQFVDRSRAARFKFSNDTFDLRFGGALVSITAGPEDAILETENGCLELPYQSGPDGNFRERMSALGKSLGYSMAPRIMNTLRTMNSSCDISSGPTGDGMCSCKSCTNLECCTIPFRDCCYIYEWSSERGVCDPSDQVACNCSY